MRSERKMVTVLFADIKGSIDLVSRQDPEQAGETLAAVVKQMSDAVHRFGGLVNQVMGDGVMALFGAPLAVEDHAAQACLAALTMRSAVHATVRPRVQVRVGLSSGEVVVRAVAGDVALHYNAAGAAVHLASRMEQVAGPDQIVLTAATLQLTGGAAEVRPLGQVAVKGLAEPMLLFELVRVLPGRTRAAPRRPGFVGRETEMAQLQAALDHAAAGEAQAIRVIAEAGCGKSRLVREFTAGRLPEDWMLCQAEAPPHRRTSYGVVADLLGSLFGFAPADDAAVRQDKVLAGLAMPAREGPDQLLAPLSSLLGLRAQAGWDGLEARERRERTIAASAEAFQRVSLHRPTALVVEDAHWLDAESAAGIQRLSTAQPGQRMLAIVTERPPETQFTNLASWSACHLRSLDERGTRSLLRSLLLPGPDVDGLERKLIEHTRGNPLFIEECLQALVDTGELVRVGERFRLERAVSVLRVPDSLRGLLDARVDRLADGDKDVLQAAAVVGTSVPVDLLGTVVNLPQATLAPVLERLCGSGFLVPAEGGGAPGYAFRHGLIREAAYNGILVRSRVRMHAAVLDALERRADMGEPGAGLLADHATQAEAWPKAVAYSRAAAAQAYDHYANPEAARYYQQALAAAEHWPDGAEKERTLLGLHIAIRWPLFRLGHVAVLRPHLDQAVHLAGVHDDHASLGQSHALRSHVLWLMGNPDDAEAAAEAARRIGAERGDRDLEIRAEFQTALVHLSQSRVPEIVVSLNRVLDHIGRPPPANGRFSLDAELSVTALGYLARALSAAGRFEEARLAVDEATQLARQADKRQNWIFTHIAEGVLRISEGRPQQGVQALEQAYEMCAKADIRLLRPVAAGFLALAYVEAGQAGRGVVLARQAVDEAERMQFLALQPMRLAILAQAHLVLGDLDSAAAAGTMAYDLALRIKEPGAGGYALGLLGEVALRRGEAERSRRMFTAALAQATALGLAPLAASLRQRLEEPDNRAHPWLDGVALAP